MMRRRGLIGGLLALAAPTVIRPPELLTEADVDWHVGLCNYEFDWEVCSQSRLPTGEVALFRSVMSSTEVFDVGGIDIAVVAMKAAVLKRMNDYQSYCGALTWQPSA